MCDDASGFQAETLTVRGTLPEVNTSGAEDPDLKPFFKKRRRDESVVKTAKTLLVHGTTPGKVALLTRLDPEFVAELAKTWNPRFRRVTHTNQHTAKRMARMYYESGALLATICRDLQLPLYTVVAHLKAEGVTDQQMAERMPESDDPLLTDYRETVARKQATPKRRSPRLHY